MVAIAERYTWRPGELHLRSGVSAAAWEEAAHPRHPKGGARGGEFRGKALLDEISRQRAERAARLGRTEPEYDPSLKGMWSPDADEYIFDPDDPYFANPVWKAIKLPDGSWKFWITDKRGFPHHDAVVRRLGLPYMQGALYSGDKLNAARDDRGEPLNPELAAVLQRNAGKYRAAQERTTGMLAASAFDPSKHPRHPAGSPRGGEFAPGDTVSGRTMVGDREVSGKVVGISQFGPIVETKGGEQLTVKQNTAEHIGDSGLAHTAPPRPLLAPPEFPDGEFTPDESVKFWPAKMGAYSGFRQDAPYGPFWKAYVDSQTGEEKAFWFVNSSGFPHHEGMARALGLPEGGALRIAGYGTQPDIAWLRNYYGQDVGATDELKPGMGAPRFSAPESLNNTQETEGYLAAKAWADQMVHRHRRDIRDANAMLSEAQQDTGLAAAAWEEEKHPRHPAGSEKGGEFAPKLAPYYGVRLAPGEGYQAYRMHRGYGKGSSEGRYDFGVIHQEEAGARAEANAAFDAEQMIDWGPAERGFEKWAAEMERFYGPPFKPDYFEKQKLDLWRRYQEGVLTSGAALAQRLAATGEEGVRLVPELNPSPGGDIDQLLDTAGTFAADFDVSIPGDGIRPGFTVWNHADGTLEVEDVLDITDTDFFPDGPDSELVTKYVNLVDAARGGSSQEGYVTLYRGMSDSEADAWHGGEEIPLGKFFTSIPTVQYAMDRSGQPPSLFTFRVPRAMVTEVGPNEFQLKKKGKLDRGEIVQASAWEETKHPRRPPGSEDGGEFMARFAERQKARRRETAEAYAAPGKRPPKFPPGEWTPGDRVKFWPQRIASTNTGKWPVGHALHSQEGPLWKALVDPKTGKELAFWFADPAGNPHHGDMQTALGIPGGPENRRLAVTGYGDAADVNWMTELEMPIQEIEWSKQIPLRHRKDIDDARQMTKALVAAVVPYTGDGGMVCLYPTPEEAKAIAREKGQPPEDLHVTLLFFPDGVPGDVEQALADVDFKGLTGEISGIARFADGEDGVPIVAIVSAPGLGTLRAELAAALPGYSDRYDFVPHMTLGYDYVKDEQGAVGLPVTFSAVKVKNKGDEPKDVLTAAAFDETKHPREPAGSEKGGQFAAKGDEALPPRLGQQPDGGYRVSKAPNLQEYLLGQHHWHPWLEDVYLNWPNLTPDQGAQLREWLNNPEVKAALEVRGMGKERREAGWVLRDLGVSETPGAEAFPQSEEFRRLQQEMADHVIVEGYNGTVEQHIKDLALFPEGLLRKISEGERGTRIYLGTTGMTGLDQQGFNKGVRPRGWPGGYTWDNVAGGYDPMRNAVILGVGHHGTASLALHETAHAIDEKYGISSSDELKAWHKELLPVLGSYEKQRGWAGRQEFWAEAVASALKGREQGAVLTGPFRSRSDAIAESAELNEWVLRKLDELAATPD